MKVEIRQVGSWVFAQRSPEVSGPHPVILMLHGWTGDEKVMWIFAPRLPNKALLVSPRGLYSTPQGGFGWHPHHLGLWPTVEDLQPAVEALHHLMAIENFPEAEIERFHIVGFSQGAALGYAFGLYYPRRVLSLGGLSGFMPERAEALINAKRLENVPVFITHGTRDDLVPVEKARQAVRDFQRAGADVFYCEDEVGHKLSSTCFTSLEHFCALNVST